MSLTTPWRPFLGTLLLISFSALASLEQAFPEQADPDARYLIYSHGYIVEGDDPRPISPRWGLYDYPDVVRALSSDEYRLIAHHRPAGTEPFGYARALAARVEALMADGVAAHNITLMGFSRGGALSVLTANELRETEINLVILAGCAGLVKGHPKVQAYGRVLSIYETTDQVGSCQFLVDRSPGVSSFKEVAITTGKGHGAFYLPREVWLKPAKAWTDTGRR